MFIKVCLGFFQADFLIPKNFLKNIRFHSLEIELKDDENIRDYHAFCMENDENLLGNFSKANQSS